MDTLDNIQINFDQSNVTLLNLSLGILMLSVAIDLKLTDFQYIFKNPKAVIAGLISQWVLLPLLTLVLAMWIQPHYSLAMGMLLIAAVPGGNVSNYTVHLAKANSALSILLTTISTVFCAVSTPLLFSLLKEALPNEIPLAHNFEISFLDLFKTIIQLIFIPLMAGLFLNYKYPNFVLKIKNGLKKISLFIFASFVIVALLSNFDNLKQYLHLVFGLVFVHNFMALTIGFVWSRYIVKLSLGDSRAISLETGIQNSGLALILVFNFFEANGGMALIAAWWSIWHLLSSSLLAYVWGREQKT